MTELQETWAEKEATMYSFRNAGGDDGIRRAYLEGMKRAARETMWYIDDQLSKEEVNHWAWSAFHHVHEFLFTKIDPACESKELYKGS